MSARRVNVVILCEDKQQECFIRRFLAEMGWDKRNFRINKSPNAGGSAEQYVRKNFPVELKIYRDRNKHTASSLIAMIDADSKEFQERMDEFKDVCVSMKIPFRSNKEAVAIAIPKRNIETWIQYLEGKEVNEYDTYPKLDRERNCKEAVLRLGERCNSQGLEENSPSTLRNACNEYNYRIKPLLKPK